MITLTDYFLVLHFVEAIWSLIIPGSKEKKKAPWLLSLNDFGNLSQSCRVGATHSARPIATSQGLHARQSYTGPMETAVSKQEQFSHGQQELTQA